MASLSFSELLSYCFDEEMPIGSVGRLEFSDRVAEPSGSGVPKFKSFPPPFLPLSPPPVSPSSYLIIPAGLSPADLLDSPLLFNRTLPSPTTGTLPFQSFNWKSSSLFNQQNIEQERKNFFDFSFQTQPKLATASSNSTSRQPSKQNEFSSDIGTKKGNFTAKRTVFPQNDGLIPSNYSNHQEQGQQMSRRSDDGYNWRKYGEKEVKGSENPRSYYKCSFPSCPSKKTVERSLDGQITAIVYRGNHNHQKPESTRRSSSLSSATSQSIQASNGVPELSFASYGNGLTDSATTPENSTITMGDDDFEQTSHTSKREGKGFNEDEPDAKRWKMEGDDEGMSAGGCRTVREPRVIVQTTTDKDTLEDGYRWKKYGQKAVKGNPNPRSYYKCTSPGCAVRKHVERASHDLRAVITTYEGRHNHDVPAARGRGTNAVNRPLPSVVKPSIISHVARPQSSQGRTPFGLDMMSSPPSFVLSDLGKSVELYMNAAQFTDNVLLRTKDDAFFESLLR